MPEVSDPQQAVSMTPAVKIHGTGEAAQLIRSRDWSGTSLGPIEGWSETLVASVNLMLLSPTAFALYWGEDLTLLYNDAYSVFLDGRHPSALGRRGSEVWEEAWSVIGPPIERAISQGASHSSTESLIPVWIDGKLQDRWWTYGVYPVYEQGLIAGAANLGSDDTPAVLARREQHKAEVERDRLASQLEHILDATTDGIAVVDREWRFTYFNQAARRIAQVVDSVIGGNIWETFSDMIYPDSPFVKNYTRAMDEGIASSFVTQYKSLGIIDLEVFSLPFPDGIILLFRDITQRKRELELLLQTEKLAAVSRLASSVAHEINNPLESVTNLLYLIRQSAEMEEIQDYAATAERELRRIALITCQTLRFHKQADSPMSAFCDDLIGESLSIYQGRLVNSNILVEKRKRAKHPVECFTGEIRQVLSSLMGNAIDAMPFGGRLVLRSRETTHAKTGRRGIVLTVADTGTGISAATQKHIFKPFFTTKGIGGTGLGLWVSAEIVKRHSGSLYMRSSQREGSSGTVMTLFLPFDAAGREQGAARQGA